MNRILVFLTFLLIFTFGDAIAQPTFRFPTEKHDQGDIFCIDVKTKDFTDILTMDFVITWDETVIEYQGVQGFGIADLDINSFVTTDVANGRLGVVWAASNPNGETVPKAIEQNYVIFQICFKAIGSFGANSPICIDPDDPVPVVTRTGTGGSNIGLLVDKGLIGVEVLPVIVEVDEIEVNQNDFFCLDLKVQNFINIESIQFTIEYNSDLIEFDGSQNYGLSGMSASSIVSNQPGTISFGWFTNNQGATLPDGSTLFSLCFKAIGDCNRLTPVEITGNWTDIEVVTGDEPSGHSGTNIGLAPINGQVIILRCNNQSGLNLVGTCPEGAPGDIVCVDVTVNRFIDLNNFNFFIQFNPNVLELTSATVTAPGLAQSILNTTGAPSGVIGVTWELRPASRKMSLPDGSDFVRLCFRIIGDGTVNSSVSFTGNPAIVQQAGSNSNYGLDPDNGCVIVNAPPGLTLSGSYHEVFPGDQVCVDVTVGAFTAINKMQFTISYEDNLLQYTSIENIVIPGMTGANFTDAGNGNIIVDWETPFGFGETLSDGTVAFQICFNVIGNPPNCSPISFNDLAIPINVTSMDTGDFNIGINENQGTVCIKNAGDFTVFGTHVTGDLNEMVCVDIKVLNFLSILETQYSINWDATKVEFDHLEFPGLLPDFDNTNFDFINTNVGVLTLSWSDLSNAGVTLADSSTIFRVCFRIIGAANTCTDIGVLDNPLEIRVVSTFSGGQEIDLNIVEGSVCINDYFRFLTNEVIEVDCPGSSTGAINVVMAGGTGPYTYSWPDLGLTTRSVSNIPAGTYAFEATDSSVPPVILRDTFVVTTSGVAPVAMVAQDSIKMNCNSTPTQVDGMGSSDGSDISYQWRAITTGSVVSPSDKTLMATVTGAGIYVLEVSNTTTGCTARDTVYVGEADALLADAGEDQMINCLFNAAELDGTNSEGDSKSYNWIALSGMLQTGTETLSRPIALTAGVFELTVTDTRTGCQGVDTVEVTEDLTIPVADVGPQVVMPCRADTLTIGGATTSIGPQYIYQWQEFGSGNIISGMDQRTAEVNSIGTYTLTVIDTINGCQADSTLVITGDPDRPKADAGMDTTLNCSNTSYMLGGSLTSTGTQYSYLWIATNGGVINPGDETLINPTISTPGTYQIRVTDTTNGCEDNSAVIVLENLTEPTLSLDDTLNIGCRVNDVFTVNASSSDLPGLNTYSWTSVGGTILSSTDTLTIEASGAGLYILETTNLFSTCSRLDTIEFVADTMMLPNIMIANPSKQYTCRDTVIQLNAIGSDNGGPFQPSWAPAQYLDSGAGTLTPKVNQPGMYFLTIVNNDNGCVAVDSVEVIENTVVPLAEAGNDGFIQCGGALADLNGTGSSVNASIVYDWTTSGSATILNSDSIIGSTDLAGVYYLTVLDDANGCMAIDSVEIFEAILPEPIIEGNELLDCNNPDIELTVGNLSPTGQFDYNWMDDNNTNLGSNTSLNVLSGGVVIIEIIDRNSNCIAYDTITVLEDFETPTVDVGNDISLDCGFVDLEISGTADGNGRSISILWTSIQGNAISDPTSLTTTIFEEGDYILNVTNTENGCFASDTLNVNVNSSLVDAMASADIGDCEDFALLTANEPAPSTGIWTLQGSGDLEDETQGNTLVSNLSGGQHLLIWTLSTTDCPNYSADTITLNVEGKPVAANDLVVLSASENSIEVNAVSNDILAGASWTFNLLNEPLSGTVDNMNNGVFDYTREEDFEGDFDLNYSICNDVCPNFCDTAFIKFTIERDPVTIDSLPPNAITPNNDGLNDRLIFDIIDERDPEDLPDNELIIFNRWGDIVYKAKPYFNDWSGTNNNGNDLPQATYYYILRLNISKGEILRGDVTILK